MFKKKSTSTVAFILSLLILAGVVYVAMFGLGNLKGILSEDGINKGLDLVGGSLIVYEADVEGTPDNLAQSMSDVKDMMRLRLDNLNYTEATIASVGDRRVQIEIPNISNPEEAVRKLGATAKLEFRNAEGTAVLEGADIERATAEFGDPNGSGLPQWYISLKLKTEAITKFEEATSYVLTLPSADRYIAIYLDEDEISHPFVSKRISGADVSISGSFSEEDAQYMAGLISAGKLPFALNEIQLKAIGPALGERAFTTSALAGAIGILLVMLFMILYYRVPGVMASLALIAYASVFFIIICGFRINLSLAGIAGIILSVGMAVDANVVIFERIKEDLVAGKSTRAAVRSGFKHALTAVMDSNITTLIAAGVLWYFGTGSIQGFATTLFIGILLSLLTAVLLTRFYLYAVVGMGCTNRKLFGTGISALEDSKKPE